MNLLEIAIIYAIMLVAGILDSYSTVRLVGNTERTEGNPLIAKSMHSKLGLKKGEYTKLAFMALIGFPFISVVFWDSFGLAYSLIPAVFYLGFYVRQFLTAIFTA